MNPHSHNNKNLHSNPSQVSVLRFEEINSAQVVPLHISENDISQEILIPHMYLAESSLPLLIGTEKEVISIENQIIPVINETGKTYQQFSNPYTVADKSHTQAKSLIFLPNAQKTLQNYQTKPYSEVIPTTSKHYAINDRLELIHPLNSASNSYTIKANQLIHPLNSASNSCTIKDNQLIHPLNSASNSYTIKDNQLIHPLNCASNSYTIKDSNQLIHPLNSASNSFTIKDNQLIHPLDSASNSYTIKDNQFQIRHSSNLVKTKLDSSANELNPPSLTTFQSTETSCFLNQPLEALTENSLDMPIINPQSLNYPYKTAKRKTESEINSTKDVGQSYKKLRKRKEQNYIHISDVKVPQRAVAVLPTALQLRVKDNIFPKRTLPARIRFGPVQGIKKVITPSQSHNLVSKADTPVFLLKKEDDIIHIDVSDKDKCNWMGLLPLGGEANVWLYQENDELYAITTEPINARKPLQLGYGKKYAEDHKMPPGLPTLDLEAVLSSNPKQWWCNECNRALPSASVLQRHSDVYHKDDVISTRGGYRCSQCRRMFSRLFTLRRHLSKHCVRKPKKSEETAEPNPTLNLNLSLNNEESRIPSDESFQNFTNGLDFSTSLFDTDRISNLDISGNSRADDFNPYDISFRDDTCTSNDLGFSKLTSGPSNTQSEANKESVAETCTYCNQIIPNNNGRKHVSECPSRKLDCACGRSFRNSEKLAQHYLKEHSENASKTTNKSPEKMKYTCEQCKSKRVSFKRRGMLVNHLWRAHKIVSTSKVERVVRHYPCVACSKIYRSAAKRDRHILVHHPGAEKLRAQSIEGGLRSCEPAACEQCPRQYATRAKLLQHVRAQHPHVNNIQSAVKKPTTKYW